MTLFDPVFVFSGLSMVLSSRDLRFSIFRLSVVSFRTFLILFLLFYFAFRLVSLFLDHIFDLVLAIILYLMFPSCLFVSSTFHNMFLCEEVVPAIVLFHRIFMTNVAAIFMNDETVIRLT